MAQVQSTLTPYASLPHFLGAELRYWRQYRGMSLTGLGRAVSVSADLLAKIEKAERGAAVDLVQRCDRVLQAGGALAGWRTSPGTPTCTRSRRRVRRWLHHRTR